jgi:hypothetical protein
MDTDERIEKLSRAADWRAAFTILTAAFPRDQRVWRHVDFEREEIHFKTMLRNGTFSSGERTLLEVAASLFNRLHSVNLWEVFNKLDEVNAALVLRAIEKFCNS